MSGEKVFVNGMIVKRRDNAPDFVVCNLSLKGAELVEFMRQHQKDGWVNIDIKRSKGGKLYAELDTWEPTQGQHGTQGMAQAKAAAGRETNYQDNGVPANYSDFEDSDLPF